MPPEALPANASVSFDGVKSTWHEGFDRYDFVMNEATLELRPFTPPDGEKSGIKDPANGQRRCVVIVPKQPAPGLPWSWRGCYWNHQPQTEVELLRRGFHIAYISSNATLKPGKEWDAWYEFLTAKHGLSTKPAFIGMSRGGEYAYTWATSHPDKVSCIYGDNPAISREALARLGGLATNDVPILHVCGSIDPLLGKVSNVIEDIYQGLGGRISMMIKDGAGHHPHSLRDPKPIVDFITQSVQHTAAPAPEYLAGRITRTAFYDIGNAYRESPNEGTYITCRGPIFTEAYDRYSFELSGVEGAITVIVPKTVMPGKPWVFRSESVSREATVDLALLAKGFHIVTGPVPYNADGPSLENWNKVYQHLVAHGLSKKPVLEGASRSAGDAYAWAIENPDTVSCIYSENPVLHSLMTKVSLLDNLAPLAKAGVPIMHISGSLDPALATNTRLVEKRYQAIGGSISVMIKEGEGHYPLGPRDPKSVVDFIMEKLK